MHTIPQYTPCSTVTRPESNQGLQKVAKKAVAFDASVLVFEDNSFSREERKDMFYTDDDMRSFRKATWRLADTNQATNAQEMSSSSHQEPLSAVSSSSSSSEEDEEVCMVSYPGMEGFLSPEHKSKHKLQGVLSVLM